jgi:hypothetical protein
LLPKAAMDYSQRPSSARRELHRSVVGRGRSRRRRFRHHFRRRRRSGRRRRHDFRRIGSGGRGLASGLGPPLALVSSSGRGSMRCVGRGPALRRLRAARNPRPRRHPPATTHFEAVGTMPARLSPNPAQPRFGLRDIGSRVHSDQADVGRQGRWVRRGEEPGEELQGQNRGEERGADPCRNRPPDANLHSRSRPRRPTFAPVGPRRPSRGAPRCRGAGRRPSRPGCARR